MLSSLISPTPLNNLLIICAKFSLDNEDRVAIRHLYQTIEDSALWSAASTNKIESVVAEALYQAVGEDIPSHWKDTYQASIVRITTYIAELDRVAAALKNRGVRVIILENGAMARVASVSPARFNFGDFDLLINGKFFDATHLELLKLGYVCHTLLDDSRLDYSNGRLEYEVKLDQHSLRLNIQSTLVARRWINSWYEPDTEDLFDHAIPVSDSEALTLNPELFLLQLCIHNASHSFIRKPGIRLHMDVDWYLRTVSINWERFTEWVNLGKLSIITYLSLAIPLAIWDTPIPRKVMISLRPSAVRERMLIGVLARHNILDPSEHKFTQVDLILLNALLHADLASLGKSIFPERAWLRQHYHLKHDWVLPIHHVIQLLRLVINKFHT